MIRVADPSAPNPLFTTRFTRKDNARAAARRTLRDNEYLVTEATDAPGKFRIVLLNPDAPPAPEAAPAITPEDFKDDAEMQAIFAKGDGAEAENDNVVSLPAFLKSGDKQAAALSARRDRRAKRIGLAPEAEDGDQGPEAAKVAAEDEKPASEPHGEPTTPAKTAKAPKPARVERVGKPGKVGETVKSETPKPEKNEKPAKASRATNAPGTAKKIATGVDPALAAKGANLRALREAKGVSIVKAAEKIGIPDNRLYRFEWGRLIPTPVDLEKIAAFLGKTVPEIWPAD